MGDLTSFPVIIFIESCTSVHKTVVSRFLSFTSGVIESSSCDLLSGDAHFLCFVLLRSTIRADEVLLECLGTTKEGTGGITLPLVDSLMCTLTNLASWQVFVGQGGWDVHLLNFAQLSALNMAWWNWIDINLLIVHVPFTSVESLPLTAFVFEDVSIVVPVAIVP
jgi:hypothetical protein